MRKVLHWAATTVALQVEEKAGPKALMKAGN
jgi:hypothetical protein